MNGKLIIALQYADKHENVPEADSNAYEHAMDAAMLYAEIEKEKRDDVIFLFSMRHDATPPKQSVVDELSKKFLVQTFRSGRQSVGWPAGSNALWHQTMLWALNCKRSQDDVECILTTEPDAVPLTEDWIDRLKDAWSRRGRKTRLLGHWYGGNHFNGNALFDVEMLKHYPQIAMCDSRTPWDMAFANEFKIVGEDCPLIVNRYRKWNVTEKELYAPRSLTVNPVFVHGVKDDSARKIVRCKITQAVH